MRQFFAFLALLCLFCAPKAQAQQEPVGEVVSSPLCFDVVNEASFDLFGRVTSNFYFTSDGTKAYHRSNFRLKPQEKARVCSTGPFYGGRRVDFSVRNMVPLFSCKTSVEGGPVTIHSRPLPEGGNKIWADCR